LQYWWMNAVCGKNNWDVFLIEKGGKIVAALVYYFKEILGRKYIIQPLLTQINGVWIKYPENQRYHRKLSYEKEIMGAIIDKLESLEFVFFDQSFHYSISNWLPFYWQGYKQTTKYTYVIENLDDLNIVFSNFSYAKRKNIKRAEKIVKIGFDLDPQMFYDNHNMTLHKQGEEILYSYSFFRRIHDAGYSNNLAKTIYAEDEEGNLHGALFTIWDNMSAYDLISTIDPDFRNSGSASLLIWEFIKYISGKVKKFDFEGSMIESVENSFRQFGAIQKPYFNIYKGSILFKYVVNKLKENKKIAAIIMKRI